MQRREFITAIGGVATAWPLGVRAQQAGKIPRIGWIILGAPAGGFADIFSYYDSFRAGLGDLGYVEGTNIILLARSALGVPEALSGLIDELLHENVSAIVSPGPAIRVVLKKSNRHRSSSPSRRSRRGRFCIYTVARQGKSYRIVLYGSRAER